MKTESRIIMFLIALVILAGCDWSKDKKSPEPKAPEETVEVQTLAMLEEVVEPAEGEVIDLSEFGVPVLAKELDEEAYVFQGDILIPKDIEAPIIYENREKAAQAKPSEKSATRRDGFWPNNTLYYQIDKSITGNSLNRVTQAIHWFNTYSNVKMVEKADSGGYVNFVKGSGCSSYVGKIGKKQNITVSTGCSTGSIKHEILHALGFWHEQSRADRDEHINIHYENLTKGTEHNFKTYIEMRQRGQDISEDLDFGSIMMYPSHSFSANGKPTITRKDGSTYRTQRIEPSKLDIEALNKLYPKQETPTKPEYENGQMYQLDGLWVRYNDGEWYFYSSNYDIWLQVAKLANGVWYYV